METMFGPLNGKSFEVDALRKELAQIRVALRGRLPTEIGVDELMDIMHHHKWLVEQTNGMLLVQL